jgi:hypothetical protein
MHTLLHDGPGGVVLQVGQVLCVFGQRNQTSAEVRALEVGHNLKALLPHMVLLITIREKWARHHRGSGDAALTQGGECDMCHLLDGSVGLAANKGSHPRHHRVEGYHHVDFTHVQAMDLS